MFKPAFNSFMLPIAVAGRERARTTIWGQVRPGLGPRPYVLQRLTPDRLGAGRHRRDLDRPRTARTSASSPRRPGTRFRVLALQTGDRQPADRRPLARAASAALGSARAGAELQPRRQRAARRCCSRPGLLLLAVSQFVRIPYPILLVLGGARDRLRPGRAGGAPQPGPRARRGAAAAALRRRVLHLAARAAGEHEGDRLARDRARAGDDARRRRRRARGHRRARLAGGVRARRDRLADRPDRLERDRRAARAADAARLADRGREPRQRRHRARRLPLRRRRGRHRHASRSSTRAGTSCSTSSAGSASASPSAT